jgi:Polyketide cyclase / dehydrase and lipid transport
VHVDAPAERVYEMVSDITRMGEWSPETVKVEWLGGASGAAPGARFKGHNRIGARRWSTKGKVAVAEPGREFVFDISSVFNLPVARWGYRMTPEGAGCTVTESWEDLRGRTMMIVGRAATGVADREQQNLAGMRATLDRLKAKAEAG